MYFRKKVQPHSASNSRTTRSPIRVYECANVYPGYNCVSKHAARTVKMAYRQPSKGCITDLVIDSAGVKVFGEATGKSENTALRCCQHCSTHYAASWGVFMRMALLQQSQPSADSVQRIYSLYLASQECGAMGKGIPKK